MSLAGGTIDVKMWPVLEMEKRGEKNIPEEILFPCKNLILIDLSVTEMDTEISSLSEAADDHHEQLRRGCLCVRFTVCHHR